MTLKNFLKLIVIFIGIQSFGYSQSTIDLTLRSATVNPRVEIGNEGTITFTIENQRTGNATGVKVFVNIPYFPPFVRFVSAVGSKGSFDVNSGLWNIGSLIGQETAILTMKYVPMEYGVWYAEAEVYEVNESDSDSTPNNNIDSEDDFTRSCFSMPIKVSSPIFGGRQIIMNDPKITSIVWRKDGQVIAGQNSNTLQITSTGIYSFDSPTFKCPTQGCCPFIFEEGPQTLCCEPLEYGLERRVSGGSISNNTNNSIEIIGNDSNMEDSDVASIAPDMNYGQNDVMDPYAWTQNGILNVKRNYIKFDMANIPDNVVIDSARLSLYFGAEIVERIPSFTGHSGENQIEIQRVLQNWSEQTITWNNKPNTTAVNSVILPKFTNNRQDYLNMNVTNLVSDMLEFGNFGFMIKHIVEVPYKITMFSTSENLNPEVRPRLKVYFHSVI